MHCLVAIIPEFQPINPQFYKDLKGYFKDFVADSSIEQSILLNQKLIESDSLHDLLPEVVNFKRNKL